MNDNLINNARELPKYWDILEEDDFLGSHNVELKITATGTKGKQAVFIIDNAPTSFLSFIKVVVTRSLLKASEPGRLQDLIKQCGGKISKTQVERM